MRSCEDLVIGNSDRVLHWTEGPALVVSNLVYVVDDDIAVGESLKFLLEINGWSVQICPSGPHLLAHPSLHTARGVLLDWHMPYMDGLRVLDLLTMRFFRGAVIVMSAALDQNMRRLAISAGAFATLQKPFSEDELVGVLNATAVR